MIFSGAYKHWTVMDEGTEELPPELAPAQDSLGSVLKQWRKSNGLRLEDVGVVVDVSRQTIANWEMDLDGSVPNVLQVLRLERRWPGLLKAIGICKGAR